MTRATREDGTRARVPKRDQIATRGERLQGIDAMPEAVLSLWFGF